MKRPSIGKVLQPSTAGALMILGLLLASRILAAEASASGARSAEQPAAALTVEVKGLRNDRGRLAVALFDSAASFPTRERAVRGQIVRIQGGRAAVTFRDLRPAVYALAVLHDENGNDKMDFNFLGMPLEGYGFSNDAAVLFGPPSFASAAFRLLPRPSVMSISARYFLL